jgi:hypothetical protein
MASTLHPQRAVRYFQGRKSGNMTPAILWLWLIAVGILALRLRAVPDLAQWTTLLIFAGVAVALGSLFPELVTALLAGIVIAAALNVPVLGQVLTNATNAVSNLTHMP